MWALLAVTLLLSLALVFLFRPQQPEPPSPASGEIDYPKVEEGDQLGRIYGCYWVTDPQVAWFGDRKAEPITKGGKK